MSENTENPFESASTQYLAETSQAGAEFNHLLKQLRIVTITPDLFTKEEIVESYKLLLDVFETALAAGSMMVESELITRDPSTFPSES